MQDKVSAVGFDGDDTLWHNERIFLLTQNRLYELLAPYGTANLRDRLHATEIRNIKVFGYGVKGFTLSMIETAIEVTGGEIAAGDIGTMLGWAREMLASPTEVLPGVRETVEALAGRYRLLLITKGDLFDQESKVARSGLGELFNAVEVVSEKDEETYCRVLERHGIAPAEFVMVGNSIRSDIAPVVAIGGRAVHVPYETTWAHEHAVLDAAALDRVRSIERIVELPELLASIDVAGREAPERPQ